MSKFVITGGAGFIGSNMVELLLSEGHDVTVYDNFSTGRLGNIERFAGRTEVVRGDVRDAEALLRALDGAEYVIHLAAEVSALKSVEDPVYVNDVNTLGTLNALNCARQAGVKRVVFASSSAVYGDTGQTPQSESAVPRPLSPYAATKVCGESFCSVFNDTYGLETVRLRYFNVYGPRQNPGSQYAAVIPRFIHRLMRGQELHIYGDGEQTRDFVFVEDVTRANYLACFSDKAAGGVFNIATGQSVTVNQLAGILMDAVGAKVDVLHDPPLPGEVRFSRSDTARARDVLGFESRFSLREGVERTVRFIGL